MPLTVAAVQHDIVWEDRGATLAHVGPMVESAAAGGAGLVLLPEMFAVGFSMDTARIEEPEDGPTTEWLADQARVHGVWIGGSVPERAPGAALPSNVFVLCGPNGERHRYAKRHPFSYSGESERFAAGDDVLTVEVGGLRISPAVCYDLRFGDQFWGQGPTTDCFAIVANWPTRRRSHWRALLVARAIENQAYVVGVNRAGTAGDGTHHSGGSCIIDPLGEVVAEAGEEEAVVLAEVDGDVVTATRTKYPFLADRR
jgi:predicted amidohydrolase